MEGMYFLFNALLVRSHVLAHASIDMLPLFSTALALLCLSFISYGNPNSDCENAGEVFWRVFKYIHDSQQLRSGCQTITRYACNYK